MPRENHTNQRGSPRVPGSLRNRELTEQDLSAAVRQIIERRGILSDFSISEVAQDAGVDRALIYRYFGDRRGLLRTALREGFKNRLARFEGVLKNAPISPGERFRTYLRTMIDVEPSLAIVTTLMIDRDPHIEVMPMREKTLPLLQADQDAGAVNNSIDVRALLAAVTSIGYGYALFRRGFADALDMPVELLDQRVDEIYLAWLDSVGDPGLTDTPPA